MPCSNAALFLCAPSKRLHLEFMIKGCVASYRLSENIHHGHWRTTKGKLSCKFLRVLIGQLVTVTKFTEIPDQSSLHLRLALTELGNMSTLGHRSTFAYQKLDQVHLNIQPVELTEHRLIGTCEPKPVNPTNPCRLLNLNYTWNARPCNTKSVNTPVKQLRKYKARHSDRTRQILNAFLPKRNVLKMKVPSEKRPYASLDFPNF